MPTTSTWDNDGISNTTEGGGVNPVVLTANNVPTYLDAAYVHPTLGRVPRHQWRTASTTC